MDDIDVRTLFFALPRTTNERIIRGIISFFSKSNLLRKLNLPEDPFEYDRVSPPAGHAERRHGTRERAGGSRAADRVENHARFQRERGHVRRDENVNYTKANLTDALKLVTFLKENPTHTMSLNHVAYATRGAYLKTLLEHLANVSEVPDDMKRSITSLMAAARLDGPGDEVVEVLNEDVVEDEVDARTFRKFPNRFSR